MKLTPVVLVLSCVCLLTGIILGHENGPDVVEVVVEEGSDAILPCSLSTKETITSNVFDWKKDDQKEVFFYDGEKHYNNGRSGQDKQFKGRVSHFPGELKSGNASIIIRNTRMEDSGNYTCVFPHLQPSQLFHIKLVVEHTFKDRSGEIRGAATKPYVKTLNQTQYWALLQCEVRGAFPKPKLHWQDSDGNILHAEEPKVTERGGSYDVILNITVNKTDNYRCVATQEEINHQIYAETHVYIHGLATKPYVTILDETEDGLLLQCEVRGASQKPKLHWQDSDGNILHAEEPKETERGGRYDVILQINVTKTDNYRCVATQEEIKHQIYSETHVYIHESCHGAGMFVGGWFSGALPVAAAWVLFEVAKRIIKRRKRGSQRNVSNDSPSKEPLNV